jgi:hypothetical protein
VVTDAPVPRDGRRLMRLVGSSVSAQDRDCDVGTHGAAHAQDRWLYESAHRVSSFRRSHGSRLRLLQVTEPSRPLHLTCSVCDSAETIRTSERLGEFFYLCRDCEHIWMVTVTATPGHGTKRAPADAALPQLPLSELPAMKALLGQTRQRTDGRAWLKSSHSMVKRQKVRAAARRAPSARAKKRKVL